MRTSQQFIYLKEDGTKGHYLLMPNEVKEVEMYRDNLDWDLKRCFERLTGRTTTAVRLEVVYYDTAQEFEALLGDR